MNLYRMNVTGDCLNSEFSPIRIADGDMVLCEEIEKQEACIFPNVGKIVAGILMDGQAFIKHLVQWNGISERLILRFYNPEETTFTIPLAKVDRLFLVKRVLFDDYSDSGKEQAE